MVMTWWVSTNLSNWKRNPFGNNYKLSFGRTSRSGSVHYTAQAHTDILHAWGLYRVTTHECTSKCDALKSYPRSDHPHATWSFFKAAIQCTGDRKKKILHHINCFPCLSDNGKCSPREFSFIDIFVQTTNSTMIRILARQWSWTHVQCVKCLSFEMPFDFY